MYPSVSNGTFFTLCSVVGHAASATLCAVWDRERESERDREREREKEGLILCSAESNMGKEMNTSIKVESLGLPVSP